VEYLDPFRVESDPISGGIGPNSGQFKGVFLKYFRAIFHLIYSVLPLSGRRKIFNHRVIIGTELLQQLHLAAHFTAVAVQAARSCHFTYSYTFGCLTRSPQLLVQPNSNAGRPSRSCRCSSCQLFLFELQD